VTKSTANVLTDNGCLTEIWRSDWALDPLGVGQVFQRTLNPGAVSAWHVHKHTTDRLFCAGGRVLVVIYDVRPGSGTHGTLMELRLGRERPLMIVVPPGVWHGIKNIGSEPALLINAVDVAYAYDDPDHFRLPRDTGDIPYRF
jgi:dTDP-4-dehydrorhamnose 3,5-epimerase